MSGPFRTSEGGWFVDREISVPFTFDHRQFHGHQGDTLASALLANGVRLVGRSFKYHRPRGIFGLGAEEPSALMHIGTGSRREPNARATVTELHDRLVAESQNRWPTLGFDLGAVNNLASRLFPAGFYYKTFMWPASRWMTYERIIRRMAGLGEPPADPDPDHYARRFVHADVLIAGGGPAGLSAALAAARSGARVILADERPVFGGSLTVWPDEIDGAPARDWVAGAVAELEAAPNVTLLNRATVAGYYDHDLVTIHERVTDHVARPDPAAPRHRYWSVRARRVVIATGAIERPVAFTDNDRPGVMLLSAVRGYLHGYGVACGKRAVLFGINDSIYDAARELHAAGVEIAAVVDARSDTDHEGVEAVRALGIRILRGNVVIAARGRGKVEGAVVSAIASDLSSLVGAPESIDCDLIAVAGGWTPAVHLHSQAKGTLHYSEAMAAFLPNQANGANASVGACTGSLSLADCLAQGLAAGREAAMACGFEPDTTLTAPTAAGLAPDAQLPLWSIPNAVPGAKQFLDLQNDVTTADVGLASREGYRSVEHLKRYTTLGMGTDQGKTSNIAGLALLAAETGEAIPAVGTTTFRPPYTPVTFGAVAAGHEGEIGHPIRRSAAHDWHDDAGAVFTDAGLWHRPQYYPVVGKSALEVIDDETLVARNAVGMVDVSTLGKLDIRGPDAAELLDRVYINNWKSLKVGRGRYGVMLREDGRIFDDGVTMRLGEDHFHMTTTTGNASGVFQFMEFMLQTAWRDLKVFVTPVTEHWFAAALSGPNARALMADLTDDIDMSNEAFPMMSIRDGHVAGIPARVMRISFSGELSYEINVAADHGAALWKAVVDAGDPHGLKVYGTEAMGVLRIEKGHFTHAEADGRVVPDDLGLARMVSDKKSCVGKRSLELPALKKTGRKQLVGLKARDPAASFPMGAQVVAEDKDNAPQASIGHVTSHCQSATLGRHIGLALVKNGRALVGTKLYVTSPIDGVTLKVDVVDPVFFDPDGERLRG